jgi:hypothetical protein
MSNEIDPDIRTVLEYLHSHLEGLIRFDENVIPIKIVIDQEGRIVAPVMVAMLTSGDTVLHMPDEEDESLHLMVTLEAFEETGVDGELADRWQIYHGEPDDVRWAIMHIDAARLNGLFFDGDALLIPNSLAGSEAAICRWANEELTEEMKKYCFEKNGVELNDPRLVGVDPLGFDVRGRFRVVRLASPEYLADEEAAKSVLARLCGK